MNGKIKMSEDTKTQVKRKRVPLSVPRMKLTAPTKPGKVRRWINDDGNRISMAQAGDYTFVEENITPGDPDVKNVNRDLGSRVSAVVGKKEDGSPLVAYLMEIDQDLYEADQRAKQELAEELEDSIRKGHDSHGQVGLDGRYVPKESIKIDKTLK
jgi:hypothetical protein